MNETKKPLVIHTRYELLAELGHRRAGQRTALVMTMGALHEGHLDLVRRAKQLADVVVVSIFVNPLQFAPGEDFAAYPRTLSADVEKLATLGVDLVFAPSPETVFPQGDPQVTLSAGPLGSVYEGATRPTHFAGVLQIVNKVINLVQPDYAIFGQKDAQQLAVIKAMVRDLDMPVEIVSVPVRREADGLAMSSRNQYLSPEERQSALALSQALDQGRAAAAQTGSATKVLEAANAVMDQAQGVKVDYVDLVDPLTFVPVTDGKATTAVLILAAWVGTTRLIDNTLVVLG
ncbi:pantoate--beta-alanine ligase [Boudabousia tangfeifanii]|uniref:Pantothenate synthetase n=1 Tax=Boudabousia tangfeifanii TaxID=1912795 RepID=A0A1D9MLJ2_9ACTO|nr:pantoate--beta-alanine ligase [Boudabousia tangfeifanii]AOZ73033.1 pantoate--beta-alanine ligase [Boudabousia tangfeifanii]